MGLEKKWMENYKKVKDFIKKNGRSPSKASKNNSEKRLKAWLGSQKQKKRQSNLSKEQTKSLNQLPDWEWK